MQAIHQNKFLDDLIDIIVEEQFSREVAEVAKIILENGPSTIKNIKSKLSNNFFDARNGLIILLQNKFANYHEDQNKMPTEIVYNLEIENILNVLRYPKILYFINLRFGETAVMILEEFMQFGILSAGQLIEQVAEKIESTSNSNTTNKNSFRTLFLTLIEESYIVQSNKLKFKEAEYSKSEMKKLLKQQAETKKVSNKKKKANAKISESEPNEILEDGNEPKKSLLGKVVEDENPLFFNKETGKYYYFYINFDKIIAELKSDLVVDFISQKTNGEAGKIASIMMIKNSSIGFKEGKSTPVTVEDISKTLVNLTQHNTGLKMTKEQTKNQQNQIQTKQMQVKKIITLLSSEENGYVIKFGNNSEGAELYCINLEEISQTLKTKTLEKIIEQHFTQNHTRIYRLLSKCGALDYKNIMDICLINRTETNTCLNQLLNEGLLETQSIQGSKSGNILFYYVNPKTNTEYMISKLYKIILNLKYFLKNEIEKIKNTESQMRQEEYINKVYGTISELDDSILVLKYF
jgi:transcription initiation factor IIE alpha subunit